MKERGFKIMMLKNGCVRILGIQSYASKDKNGNPVINNNIHFCENFNEYDMKNGAMGLRCSSEFTRMDLPPTLKPDDICRLSYSKGFQDKAVLSDIEIIEPSTPTVKK